MDLAAKSRQQIAKLPKEEVEDRLYSVTEENIELKKHGHIQDEKLKRLATKILRLKSDMKKLGVGKPMKYSNENDVVEDLQHKVVTLEQQVNTLQSKLKAAKHNTGESARKPTNIYSFVESRVDTGQPEKFNTPIKRTPVKKAGQQFPQYGNSMLQAAKQEIEQLDGVVEDLRGQIEVLEDEKQSLVHQQQDLELNYENTILALREQLLEIQRTGIDEDINVINLQREIKDKEDNNATSTNKLLKAKNELAQCRNERDKAEIELDELKLEMKKMDKKLSSVKNKANESILYTHEAQELTLALDEVRSERDLLREENSRLMSDIFSGEKEKMFKQNERKLRERVKQLEHRLDRCQTHPAHDSHDEIFDKYLSEKEKTTQLEHSLSKLEMNSRIIEGELNSTKQQMKEAEMVRLKEKEKYQTSLITAQMSRTTETKEIITTLQNTEPGDDLEKELSELQTEYAAVVIELERTVKLLEIQFKLNKEYQDEVTSVTVKYEKVRRNAAQREDETAKLLDIRGARINKLELQLRDIAYGTKAVRLEAPTYPEESLGAEYDNVRIERGQNIVEVHFGKLYLSEQEIKQGMFLIFGFHHFEIVTSPVKTVKSLQPDFNFTTHYVVNVDDFFLRCLQRVSSTVYLYSCTGMDFRCVAVCQLHFKELLDNATGNRLHGSLQMLGTEGSSKGMSYGNLDYSIRLRLPMVHALQLFKEKIKANTYLSSNIAQPSQAEPTQDDVSHSDPQFNELRFSVLRCQELPGHVQPSAYIVYKFYTFPDHDTSIIISSNSPQFNDVMIYPVTVDTQLHRYLTQGTCKIYILNDSETDYLIATVDISLIPLAHGKSIEGTFQLSDGNGHPAGFIEVDINWTMTYFTPVVSSNRIPCEKLDRLPEQIPSESLYSPRTPEPLQPSANPITQSIPLTINPASQPGLTDHVQQPSQSYEKSLHEAEEELIQAELDREDEIIKDKEEEEARLKDEKIKSEFLSFRSVEEYEKAVDAQSKKLLKSSQAPLEPHKSPELAVRSPQLSTKSISSTNVGQDIEEDIVEELEGTEDITAVSQLKMAPSNTFDDSSSEDEGVVLGTATLHEIKAGPSSAIPDSPDSPDTPQVVPARPLDTTFFEEVVSTESEDDVVIPGMEEALISTDEDELVVVTPSPGHSLNTPRAPPIVVVVHYIMFDDTAHFINQPEIKQVFVEYKLLGVDPADTETPQSLKVKGGVKLSYNFRKTFYIERSSEEWILLNEMISDRGDRKITFTVVSDPGEATDKECVNLCKATVDLPMGDDISDQTLDLISESEGVRVGIICVTMETCKALNALNILPES